jgi:Protein of unknown function (DUF4031)
MAVMAILIDPPAWPAHGRLWSHLVSDRSFEELHRFAQEAGIPVRGFEGDHYDVPEERYAAMLTAGARPVSGRELLDRLRRAGLRRPKRRGERVVASLAESPHLRLDVLTSTLPPTRPVTAVWALVTGRPGVLTVPHGTGWAPPRADLGPPPTAATWAEVAAALAGLPGLPASGWRQVGYLRRQPVPDLTAGPLPRPDVELVLHATAEPRDGLVLPPARWSPAAEVGRAVPALRALLEALALGPRT